jgi:hypothetical protein
VKVQRTPVESVCTQLRFATFQSCWWLQSPIRSDEAIIETAEGVPRSLISGIPLSGRDHQMRPSGQKILFHCANVTAAWSSDKTTHRPPEVTCRGPLLLQLSVVNSDNARTADIRECAWWLGSFNAVMLRSDNEREFVTYSTLSIMGERSLSLA